MKMTFGKYNNIDICFINSNYLKWLLDQNWFLNKEKNGGDDKKLVLAVDKEYKWREDTGQHFYEDKVWV